MLQGGTAIFRNISHPSFWQRADGLGKWKFAFAAVLFAGLAACSTPEIDAAFGPDTKPGDSNKVIIKYCASCHLHKDFDSGAHMEKVRPRYSVEPYKSASECRACHIYSKNWLMDVKRGTHREGLKKQEPPKADIVEQ